MIILSFVLAACGGAATTEAPAPDETEAPPAETEAPPADTEAPVETEAPPAETDLDKLTREIERPTRRLFLLKTDAFPLRRKS